MKSMLGRAAALGAILLLAAGPSVLAVPVAQGGESATDVGSIETDSSKTTASLAGSRFQIKCYSKDASGNQRVDNAKYDTCMSADHAAFCNEQGRFQCALPAQCDGCTCV